MMNSTTLVNKDNDIKICIEDIDLTRISYENVRSLQQLYPNEDTETLCRYLLGKKNDFEKTKQQLDRAIVLRNKGYWNIHKTQCINEINYGKCYLNGYDKDGYPLLVITARLHNPTASVLQSDHRCDLYETTLMTLWWTEVAISKLSLNKSKITMLIDRSGCDDVPLDKEYMQLMSDIYQVCILDNIIIIITYNYIYLYIIFTINKQIYSCISISSNLIKGFTSRASSSSYCIPFRICILYNVEYLFEMVPRFFYQR